MSDNSHLKKLNFLFFLLMVAFISRFPTLFVNYYNDEAFYASVAQALIGGKTLYINIVDQKPPLIYWLFEIFVLIGKWKALYVGHAATILVITLTSFFTGLVAQTIGGEKKHIYLAATLYILATTSGIPVDTGDTNAELLFNLPLSLHYLLVLMYVMDGRKGSGTIYLVCAGIFAGLAMLVKQQPLFTFMGTIFFILLCSKDNIKMRIAATLKLCVGSAIPILTVMAILHYQGSLDAAYYWLVTFSRGYISEGNSSAVMLRHIVKCISRNVLLAQPGLWIPLAVCLIIKRNGHRLLPEKASVLYFWLAFGFLAVFPGYRFFGHYFYQYLPPLCVMAAFALVFITVRFPAKKVAVFFCIPIFSSYIFGWVNLWQKYDIWHWPSNSKVYSELIKAVGQYSGPEDNIDIWGSVYSIPFLANRKICTRFVDKRFLTGFYKEMDTAQTFTNSAQGEQFDRYIEDLNKCMPKLILDMSKTTDLFPGPEINKNLMDFFTNNYDKIGMINNSVIYRLK